MKALILLILIAGLAGGAYWYLTDSRHKEDVRQVEAEAAKRAEQVKEALKDKLKDVQASAPEIKEDLQRTGKAVRDKAAEVGVAIKEATADARITAAIKAKLVKDPNLSALKISVSTTDGMVTLSGSVASRSELDQAMELAKATDGVREAISTIQIKGNR